MARHRDFHNMDTEDFEEDGDYSSSFASSFNDEVSLSKSVEKEYIVFLTKDWKKLWLQWGQKA